LSNILYATWQTAKKYIGGHFKPCKCLKNYFTVIYLIQKTRKAVVARRYLRPDKAIRQVASPSSLCQRFPYGPFNPMVTKFSKWFRIQNSCRITPKI